MSNQKAAVEFPRYHLIVDDTGDDKNNKYHVGFFTPKMTTEELNLAYNDLKKYRDEAVQKINGVIGLFNDILQAMGGEISTYKIYDIKEMHAIQITALIKNFTRVMENKNILPLEDKQTLIETLRNNPSFQTLIDISDAHHNIYSNMFTSNDDNAIFDDTAHLAKFLIGDYYFDYANKVAKLLADCDLKIITSVPVSDAILEGSQLNFPNNNPNKVNEIKSLQNLCNRTLEYISTFDDSAHIHVKLLCDNGIRNNIKDVHLFTHKENDPFSIKKITADFQDSKTNYFLEAADTVAWMNNRFEKMILKKLTQGKELKYLDERVYDIFTKNLLPEFIKSDYDRLADILQENSIQRKSIEKTTKAFVERVVESLKGKENSNANTNEDTAASNKLVK